MAPLLRRRNKRDENSSLQSLSQNSNTSPVVLNFEKCAEEVLSHKQQLDSMIKNWFSFLNNNLVENYDKMFDELIELRKDNNELKSELGAKQKQELDAIVCDMDLSFESIQECETQLKNTKKVTDNECKALRESLKRRKTQKTNSVKKLKTLSDRLEDLKSERQELMDQMSDKEEAKHLADMFGVKYRLTSSSVRFDFFDRKRNQSMISSLSNGFTEEFWSHIGGKYDLIE